MATLTLPLLMLLQLTTAFIFTGPSSSEPLNLSSTAITITWDPETQTDRIMALWFDAALLPSGRSRWTLESNITLSNTTSYTWDPTNITEGLKQNDNEISNGKDYFFLARITHPDLGSSGGTQEVESDMYEIVGYERTGTRKSAAISMREAGRTSLIVAVTLMSGVWGLI